MKKISQMTLLIIAVIMLSFCSNINNNLFDEKTSNNPELKNNFKYVQQILDDPNSLFLLRNNTSRTSIDGLLYKKQINDIENIIQHISNYYKGVYQIKKDTIFNYDFQLFRKDKRYKRHQIFLSNVMSNTNRLLLFDFIKYHSGWKCFNIEVTRTVFSPNMTFPQ